MNGQIPTINITGTSLPEVWEQAVIAVYDQGIDIKTQYDKPEDLPSKDATVMITVDSPFAEPRIHKNFPGGPEELESYNQEVLYGIHNHWIDPENKKWTYTYNERLFEYSPCEDLNDSNSPRPFEVVDQVKFIVDNLVNSNYSRRAQGITWQPTCDTKIYDPPCLQRIWCRMPRNENGDLVLNMNTHWRSRDLYRAWFMNAYAMTNLQDMIADEISERLGEPVLVGRYVDISDSLHLYGSLMNDITVEVEKMKTTTIENRVWETTHPAFEIMTDDARANLAKDPDFYAKPK